MAIQITKELNKRVKDYKLEDERMIAMADLMALGWTSEDAYIVAYNPDTSYPESFVLSRVKEILRGKIFKSYLALRSGEINKTVDVVEKEEKVKKKKVNLEDLSKEDILKELQLTLDDLEAKDKSGVLMKIAELKGYKKEVIQEDEIESKVTYLPQKCFNCKWYKGREEDKIE